MEENNSAASNDVTGMGMVIEDTLANMDERSYGVGLSENEASEKEGEEKVGDKRAKSSSSSYSSSEYDREETDEQTDEQTEDVVDVESMPPPASDKTLLPSPIWVWMVDNDLKTDSEKHLGEQLGRLRDVIDRSQLEKDIKAEIVEAFKRAYKTAEEANAKKTQWIKAFEVLCNKSQWIELMRNADRQQFKFRNISKKKKEYKKKEKDGKLTEAEKVVFEKRRDLHNLYKTVLKRQATLFDFCVNQAFSKKRELEDAGQEDECPTTRRIDRSIGALMKIVKSKKYTKELRAYLIRELETLAAIQPADGPKQTKIPKQKVPKHPRLPGKTLPRSESRKLA